jgi:F0F1-type ATP synthase assembly protein I
MPNNPNRSDSGGFSEGPPNTNSTDTQDQRNRTARQEAELSARKREFSEALRDAERNAEQAGRATARKLTEGFIQGLGRRAGELVWDILTGNVQS